jgi:hypothetical protein
MNGQSLRWSGRAPLCPDLAACFAIGRAPRARRDRPEPASGILAELAKYGRP